MEFKESKPIYLQIADRICDEILSGKYPEMNRIPSVREYGASVEVNPNTVVRSFEYLTNNGIIFNKRGMGYFVSEEAKNIIHKLRRDVFLSETLPEFFKEIDILGISIDEVSQMYAKCRS